MPIGQATPKNADFAPLPLRARGTLELFDVAIKVCKRNFGILLLWSGGAFTFWFVLYSIAAGNYLNLAPEEWVAFAIGLVLLTPFAANAGMCCVMTTVRGRATCFRDSWRFTLPRFFSWWYIVMLASRLAILVAAAGGALCDICLSGLRQLQSSKDMPIWLSSVSRYLFLGLAGALYTSLLVAAGLWVAVTTVAGLSRSAGRRDPRKRSVELLNGNWWRLFAIAVLISLSAICAGGVLFEVGTFAARMALIPEQATGIATSPHNSSWNFYFFGAVGSLVGLVYLPFTMIMASLFYLDLRVRKDGLDIEWNAQMVGLAAASPAATSAGRTE